MKIYLVPLGTVVLGGLFGSGLKVSVNPSAFAESFNLIGLGPFVFGDSSDTTGAGLYACALRATVSKSVGEIRRAIKIFLNLGSP